MAITGINTGSGYNAYTPGGGIGSLGREKINGTFGSSDFGKKSVSEKTAIEKAPLENQVAVSKDGDTLQISPKAVAKFDMAIKEAENKEKHAEAEKFDNIDEAAKLKNEQVEAARKEARLKAERRAEILKELAKMEQKKEIRSEEKQAVSFAGKSDSDITRLYLEGEITKSDYDSEMSGREKLREQTAKKDNDFINKTSEGNKREKKIERFSKDLKAAFSDKTSKTFDAVTRLDTIEAAEGIKKAEHEKNKAGKKEIKFSYK